MITGQQKLNLCVLSHMCIYYLDEWRSRFEAGSFHAGFVVEKVALGQVSLQLLWFSKMILIVIFKGTLK
jgi:hypothetical protein